MACAENAVLDKIFGLNMRGVALDMSMRLAAHIQAFDCCDGMDA